MCVSLTKSPTVGAAWQERLAAVQVLVLSCQQMISRGPAGFRGLSSTSGCVSEIGMALSALDDGWNNPPMLGGWVSLRALIERTEELRRMVQAPGVTALADDELACLADCVSDLFFLIEFANARHQALTHGGDFPAEPGGLVGAGSPLALVHQELAPKGELRAKGTQAVPPPEPAKLNSSSGPSVEVAAPAVPQAVLIQAEPSPGWHRLSTRGILLAHQEEPILLALQPPPNEVLDEVEPECEDDGSSLLAPEDEDESPHGKRRIQVGDQVTFIYLDALDDPCVCVITDGGSDDRRGLMGKDAPMAEALLRLSVNEAKREAIRNLPRPFRVLDVQASSGSDCVTSLKHDVAPQDEDGWDHPDNLYCFEHEMNACGVFVEGGFLVRRGSSCSPDRKPDQVDPSHLPHKCLAHNYRDIRARRQALVAEGVLSPGRIPKFLSDYRFDTLALAASVLLSRPAHGGVWKRADEKAG